MLKVQTAYKPRTGFHNKSLQSGEAQTIESHHLRSQQLSWDIVYSETSCGKTNWMKAITSCKKQADSCVLLNRLLAARVSIIIIIFFLLQYFQS